MELVESFRCAMNKICTKTFEVQYCIRRWYNDYDFILRKLTFRNLSTHKLLFDILFLHKVICDNTETDLLKSTIFNVPARLG